MHTSHGTMQGYNGQAIVDSKHQVIVYGEAIVKGLDNDNLPPVVDGAKGNLESIGKSHDFFEGKILMADYKLPQHNQFKQMEQRKTGYVYP